MRLIQLKREDFMDYGAVAQHGKYSRIPYTRVKSLLYEQAEPKVLKFKTAFSAEWLAETVLERKSTRAGHGGLHFEVPNPVTAKSGVGLSQAKKNDIRAILKFMPHVDKVFMSNVAK